MGENGRAIRTLEEAFDGRVDNRPQWSAQGAPLLTADIYFAAGETARANRLAAAALERGLLQPLTNGYAGVVARWTARAAIESGGVQEGAELIAGLRQDLDLHDLLDQAELLCATLHMDRVSGANPHGHRLMLVERLSKLPNAVEHQLRRLGAMT